jgi:hypothetical protein
MTRVNKGHSNIKADWMRARFESVMIDGVSLSKVISPHIINKQDGSPEFDPESFFKNVILQKITDEKIRDEGTQFLMQTFHQGGLLCPVSNAAATHLLLTDKKDGCGFMRVPNKPTDENLEKLTRSHYLFDDVSQPQMIYYYNSETKKLITITSQGNLNSNEHPANLQIIKNFKDKYPNNIDKLSMDQVYEIASLTKTSPHLVQLYVPLAEATTRQREIITTPTGFTIKEYFQIQELGVCDETGSPIYDENSGLICLKSQNNPGEQSLMEGMGVLEVDLSADKPILKPLENFISFHHSDLRAKLSKRSFIELLIDWCRYYLGSNQAELPMRVAADDGAENSIKGPS